MGIFDIFKTSKTSYKKVFAEYIRQQELISPVIFLAFQANHSEILSDNPKYSEEIKKLLMVVYFYGALDGMAFLIDEKGKIAVSLMSLYLSLLMVSCLSVKDYVASRKGTNGDSSTKRKFLHFLHHPFSWS